MFKLPDLPYGYNALEPVLSETTMRTHGEIAGLFSSSAVPLTWWRRSGVRNCEISDPLSAETRGNTSPSPSDRADGKCLPIVKQTGIIGEDTRFAARRGLGGQNMAQPDQQALKFVRCHCVRSAIAPLRAGCAAG